MKAIITTISLKKKGVKSAVDFICAIPELIRDTSHIKKR